MSIRINWRNAGRGALRLALNMVGTVLAFAGGLVQGLGRWLQRLGARLAAPQQPANSAS